MATRRTYRNEGSGTGFGPGGPTCQHTSLLMSLELEKGPRPATRGMASKGLQARPPGAGNPLRPGQVDRLGWLEGMPPSWLARAGSRAVTTSVPNLCESLSGESLSVPVFLCVCLEGESVRSVSVLVCEDSKLIPQPHRLCANGRTQNHFLSTPGGVPSGCVSFWLKVGSAMP